MEDRFEKFTFLVFKMAKLIQRIKNIEMSSLGLKAVHVMCIYHLSKNDKGLTSKELVDLTLEDKAAVSRALAYLKTNEFISYKGGYNALITLTEKGEKIAYYIDEKSKNALEGCSKDISDEEREELYSSLKKIEANMEIYYHILKGSEK